MSASDSQASIYRVIIERVFEDRYRPGANSVSFHRDDLATAAERLGLDTPATWATSSTPSAIAAHSPTR